MTTARTYRGSTAAERTTRRRRQLLDATIALWGDPERPAVTMTGVCREAGLTERYFYESFTHLDEALVAVVVEIADEIERATVETLAAAGPAPGARARALVGAFVGVLTDDPRRGRAALLEAASRDATRPQRALLLRRFARRAAREVRSRHGADAWAEPTGGVQAAMFVGGVALLVESWLDGTLACEPRTLVDTAVAALTQE